MEKYPLSPSWNSCTTLPGKKGTLSQLATVVLPPVDEKRLLKKRAIIDRPKREERLEEMENTKISRPNTRRTLHLLSERSRASQRIYLHNPARQKRNFVTIGYNYFDLVAKPLCRLQIKNEQPLAVSRRSPSQPKLRINCWNNRTPLPIP